MRNKGPSKNDHASDHHLVPPRFGQSGNAQRPQPKSLGELLLTKHTHVDNRQKQSITPTLTSVYILCRKGLRDNKAQRDPLLEQRIEKEYACIHSTPSDMQGNNNTESSPHSRSQVNEVLPFTLAYTLERVTPLKASLHC